MKLSRHNDTDDFRDRMKSRYQRKRLIRDEDPTDGDADDRSQSRPSRRRTDELSRPVERNGSGDSSLNGSAAREAFGFLAVPPALFSALGFPDLSRAEAGMLHPEPASGQFHPSFMHVQGTRQTFQEPSELHLSFPDATGLFPSLLRQQNLRMRHALQQRHLMPDALQQQQQMQHTNGLFASGGCATYANPFSERMNDATTATASLCGSFPSFLPRFATNDPSQLLRHICTPLSSRSSDEGQPAAFARPSIAAKQDSCSPSAVMPSAMLRASAPGRLPGGLQMTLDPPSPLHIPKPRTEDLYTPCDDNFLSVHQITIRKQIEFFAVQQEDIDHFSQERRKNVSIGQVGIRCRHCAGIPRKELTRCAMYFPTTIRALYQAAQHMASVHFTGTCAHINPQLKAQLIDFQEKKAVFGRGGKNYNYWAERANVRGVYETEQGLRFRDVD